MEQLHRVQAVPAQAEVMHLYLHLPQHQAAVAVRQAQDYQEVLRGYGNAGNPGGGGGTPRY